MRISLLAIPLLLAISPLLYSDEESRMSIMKAVVPESGTNGDVFAVEGTNLGEAHVAAVFLTDGKNDFKVVIVAQTATSIRFKIPAEVTAGRYALMVLTTEKDARLLEQPVKVTVETASRPTS